MAPPYLAGRRRTPQGKAQSRPPRHPAKYVADFRRPSGRMRCSNFVIAIVDRCINGLQCLDQMIRGKIASFELALEDLIIGPKVNEAEPSPQCMIDKRNGAVGGVHRADEKHVLRNTERAALARERDCLVPI